MFLTQPETISIKDDCYNERNYQKLKEKYVKLRAEATKLIGYPTFKARNLSAIEDEPNKIFCAIRRIEVEEEESKEEQKKRMIEIESAVTKNPMLYLI